MDILATLSSKNQITIPKAVRSRLNLQTCDTVVFRTNGDDVFIERANLNFIPSIIKSILQVVQDSKTPIYVDLATDNADSYQQFINELLTLFVDHSVKVCSSTDDLRSLSSNTIVVWDGLEPVPTCEHLLVILGDSSAKEELFKEQTYYKFSGTPQQIDTVCRISHPTNTLIYTLSNLE